MSLITFGQALIRTTVTLQTQKRILEDRNRILTDNNRFLEQEVERLQNKVNRLNGLLNGQEIMAALYNKVQNEAAEQREIESFNNPKIDLKNIKEFYGKQKEGVDGWIRIIDQLFEASPLLPKGNEPNTRADGSAITLGILQDEEEPGIAWTTVRLVTRPRNNTDLSNVPVNKALDGTNSME